jgi:cytoskeletal protein RodZ
MQTLGQKFRAAREAKALTVDGIASETRINATYLRALESDDRSAFPGAFFYRAFIRQYAQILELEESSYQAELERSLADQEKMLQDLASHLMGRKIDVPPLSTGSGWNTEETKRWLLRVAVLAFVLLACTGAYRLWERYQTGTTEPPAASAANEPAPAVSQPVRRETVEKKPAAPPPSVPLSEAPAPRAPAPTEAARTVVESRPAAETAKPPGQPAVTGAPGPVRVRLVARELCWVDSWRGTQHYFSSALKPGETHVLTGSAGMRVLLGNAGGVEIEFNGRVIPPAGPRGQVRTLEFGADTYRVVWPARPPETPPAPPRTQN